MSDDYDPNPGTALVNPPHWSTDFGFELADTTRLFRKTFNLRVEKYGITGSLWRIIAYLMRHDGMSQVEIADEIELDKAAVGRTIERLELREMVRRENCDKDGRVRRVFLRSKSFKLGDKIKQEAQEYYNEILAVLSPAEEVQFKISLSKVRAQIIKLHDAERGKKSSN